MINFFYTGSTQNGNGDASRTIHVTSGSQGNSLSGDSSSSSSESSAEELSDDDSVHSVDLISDDPTTSNVDLRAIDQAGANIHNDDDDMGSPIFSSTHVATNHISVTQLPSSSKKGEHFVQNLYDSVKVSDVFIDEGTSMAVTEVGTIEELPDLLIGSETNENSGPAYDLQMFRRLLTAHQVPQLLPFLCLDAPEMRMQSHADCSPVMLIRFLPTEATASILRSAGYYIHAFAHAIKTSKPFLFGEMFHQAF